MSILFETLFEESRLRIEDVEIKGFLGSGGVSSSNQEIELEDPQPEVIKRKKTSCQKLCSALCNKIPYLIYLSTPYSVYLTHKEVSLFSQLCSEGDELFEPDNQEHENLLKDFYNKVKGNLDIDLNSVDAISIWKLIGFQTDNPRTDFRAAGIISLKFMIFFVSNYNNEFMKLIELNYFLFAVVCIKLSVGLNYYI